MSHWYQPALWRLPREPRSPAERDRAFTAFLRRASPGAATVALRCAVIAHLGALFGGGRVRCPCGRRGLFALAGDGPAVAFACPHCGRVEHFTPADLQAMETTA